MSNFFIYNGKSSASFGLKIESKDVFSAPEFDLDFISIPGRNGDLINSNRRYANVKVSYTVFLKKEDIVSLSDTLTSIKAWLYTEPDRYHEISDSYDKKHIRYGVISKGLDIEEQLNKVGSFTVTFNCKPMKHSVEGLNEVAINNSDFTLVNPYPFESSPYLKITGFGSGTLTIQSGSKNKTWIFSDIESYIECDSEQMNFYKATELQNHKVIGEEYPHLYPGENTITYSGGIQTIRLIPRWCCL